jgi:hypothetical protein
MHLAGHMRTADRVFETLELEPINERMQGRGMEQHLYSPTLGSWLIKNSVFQDFK